MPPTDRNYSCLVSPKAGPFFSHEQQCPRQDRNCSCLVSPKAGSCISEEQRCLRRDRNYSCLVSPKAGSFISQEQRCLRRSTSWGGTVTAWCPQQMHSSLAWNTHVNSRAKGSIPSWCPRQDDAPPISPNPRETRQIMTVCSGLVSPKMPCQK